MLSPLTKYPSFKFRSSFTHLLNFAYQAGTLWNNIPNALKEWDSLGKFSMQLTEWNWIVCLRGTCIYWRNILAVRYCTVYVSSVLSVKYYIMLCCSFRHHVIKSYCLMCGIVFVTDLWYYITIEKVKESLDCLIKRHKKALVVWTTDLICNAVHFHRTESCEDDWSQNGVESKWYRISM